MPLADPLALADGAWRRGLAVPEPEPVSEWADAHRIITDGPEPGPWQTSRVPFLREPQDAMTPGNGIELVVLYKASQVAGTQAALNFAGTIIHRDPRNILWVLPDQGSQKKLTSDKLDPLLERTPALRDLVVAYKSRDRGNSAVEKRFVGGSIFLAKANAPTDLRGVTAPYIVLDEVDGFPAEAGEEGDPVTLAQRAAKTFRGRRKVIMISTPTRRGHSRIEAALLTTDAREYLVPCPGCGFAFAWKWKHVQWPEGRRADACIVCPECGHPITETERQALIAAGAGTWTPTREAPAWARGYVIGGLLSPWNSLAEMAVTHGNVCRFPTQHKAFRNLTLGDVWDDDGSVPPDTLSLLARCEDWGELVPPDVVALTVGVDTQDDRLELELVGWGRGFESWSLAHEVIQGSPGNAEPWELLDDFLDRRFAHAREVPDLPIRGVCIDSGGHHTGAVYRYATPRLHRRIWAIKGRGGPIPVWEKSPPRVVNGTVKPVIIGTDTAKEEIYARLKLATPGPGYCHFPDGREAEWFKQLTSERLVRKVVKGRQVSIWEPTPNTRQEALDCRVYAYAALCGLVAQGLVRLDREADAMAARPLRNAPPAGQAVAAIALPPAARPLFGRSKFLAGLR